MAYHQGSNRGKSYEDSLQVSMAVPGNQGLSHHPGQEQCRCSRHGVLPWDQDEARSGCGQGRAVRSWRPALHGSTMAGVGGPRWAVPIRAGGVLQTVVSIVRQ